jgi:hypothetical protein
MRKLSGTEKNVTYGKTHSETVLRCLWKSNKNDLKEKTS